MAITSREELNAYAEKFLEELDTKKKRVLVCAGTGCLANGSDKVIEDQEELVDAVAIAKADAMVFARLTTRE